MPKNGELLVALHNNSEEYSVNSEVGISDMRSLKQPDNPHAFYLCTDPGDYQILATSPYNVVLQQHVARPMTGRCHGARRRDWRDTSISKWPRAIRRGSRKC